MIRKNSRMTQNTRSDFTTTLSPSSKLHESTWWNSNRIINRSMKIAMLRKLIYFRLETKMAATGKVADVYLIVIF